MIFPFFFFSPNSWLFSTDALIIKKRFENLQRLIFKKKKTLITITSISKNTNYLLRIDTPTTKAGVDDHLS